MSPAQTDVGTSAVKKDLLARLGLAEGADEQSVRSAHRTIVEFLDSAPDDITRWAGRRKQEADRLLSLLTGPESALAPLERQAAPAASKAVTGRAGLPKPLLVLLGAALIVGIVFGVYQLGKPASDLPAMTAAQGTATPVPTVDATQLSQLMAKIQANPKDTDSLEAIAELYAAANDFKSAKPFLDKILAYDPKNQKALIESGAAAYNVADYTTAVQAWTLGTQYYPDSAELHYDLGFAYMMSGQNDKMQAEWAQVVKLAPDSDMAKNVQQHVNGTKSSATPTAAGTPAPSATPSK